MPATKLVITDEQKRQYEQDGYFILERAIPDEHLKDLQDECEGFIDKIHAQMDEKKTDVLGISHRKRYFVSNRNKESAKLRAFLFSDLMADICRATLGDDAFLFHEQYVVKAAEVGMKFAWHQDSGYVGHDHRPYLSCWCALDDMTEENGTVYILPYSRAGVRRRIDHVKEEGTNDLVGYHGNDPGEPVIVPAGSIAVFSSVCFHRSGTNVTKKMRRVYLAQYSAEPIMTKDGSKQWALAEPILRDGKKVNH